MSSPLPNSSVSPVSPVSPSSPATAPPSFSATRRAPRRRVAGLAAVACAAIALAGAASMTGHLPAPTGTAGQQQAINPQPLPPRGGDDAHASRAGVATHVSFHGYIGETEKSAPSVTPMTLRPA